MVHLDYRDARPIYTQVFEGFRDQIAAGVLRPGDKLPSVRELAVSLAINPNTIQRSYRQLEREGWIVTIAGKGCFVSGETDAREKERQRWFTAFEEAAETLLSLGVTREELAKRLQKGER